MKKSALILAVSTLLFFGCKSGEKHETIYDGPIQTVPQADRESSKTSLDWAGVYEGTTPCADCDGIKTKVELKTDKSFTLTQIHMGKNNNEVKFKESGNFTWDEDGNSIILETGKHRIRFGVDTNELTLLDMAGNVAGGELANFYVLKKTE